MLPRRYPPRLLTMIALVLGAILTALYAVGIDGSNPRDLTPFEKVRAQIIDRLERNPNEILVSLNKRERRVFDVYRALPEKCDFSVRPLCSLCFRGLLFEQSP